MLRTILFFIVMSLLVIIGCKEKDDIPPTVQILNPSGGNPTYNYEDLVFVRAQANDENGIRSWIVKLTDESGRVRYNSGVIETSGDPVNIDETISFILEDVHWPSGSYSLGFFATDFEGNEGAAFKEVTYFEAPLTLDNVLTLTSDGVSSNLYTLNESDQFVEVASLSGDMNIAYAGSYHSEVLVGGGTTGRLDFLDDETFQVIGTYANSNPLNGDFVRDITFDEDQLYYYVSFFDGTVRSFAKGGTQRSIIEVGDNFRPESVLVIEDDLFVEVQQVGTTNFFLQQYNKNSGALENSNVLPGDLEGLFAYESDNILAIGNGGDGIFARVFDQQTLSFFDPTNYYFADEPIETIEQIGPDSFIIGHTSSSVVYLFSFQSFLSEGNSFDAQSIAIDQVSGNFYTINDNELGILNSNAGFIESLGVPANSREVITQMNK